MPDSSTLSSEETLDEIAEHIEESEGQVRTVRGHRYVDVLSDKGSRTMIRSDTKKEILEEYGAVSAKTIAFPPGTPPGHSEEEGAVIRMWFHEPTIEERKTVEQFITFDV